MLSFLIRFFKKNFQSCTSGEKTIENYFLLQKYLLQLERNSCNISSSTLFNWTTVTNLKSQKVIIYRQLQDYDNKPIILKFVDIFNGKRNEIAKKRDWLAFQEYKILLRGVLYPEPILHFAHSKLSSKSKTRESNPGKLNSILSKLNNDLKNLDLDNVSLELKLKNTLNILKYGNKVRFGVYDNTLTHNTPDEHSNLQKEQYKIEVTNKLHQYYFLCGVLNLNPVNADHSRKLIKYELLMRSLESSQRTGHFLQVQLFFKVMTSLSIFLNSKNNESYYNEFKLCHVDSLREALRSGLTLQKSYLNQLAISFKNADFSKPIDTVVVSNSKVNDHKELCSDKKLLVNFIKACGFYNLSLDNNVLEKMIKSHRAMQMRLHPDKIKRQYQFKNSNITLDSNLQDHYIKLRTNLFDEINSFFNLKFYLNKNLDFSIFSKNEISFYFNSGKKFRCQFDASFNSTELENEKIIEIEKLFFTVQELFTNNPTKLAEMRSLHNDVIKLRSEAQTYLAEANTFRTSMESCQNKYEALTYEYKTFFSEAKAYFAEDMAYLAEDKARRAEEKAYRDEDRALREKDKASIEEYKAHRAELALARNKNMTCRTRNNTSCSSVKPIQHYKSANTMLEAPLVQTSPYVNVEVKPVMQPNRFVNDAAPIKDLFFRKPRSGLINYPGIKTRKLRSKSI